MSEALEPGTVQIWLAAGRDLDSPAIVRAALARHLDVRPDEVHVEHERSGRPVVAGHRIAVSCSHTHDLVLVAVGAGQRIGIDVELLRDGPWRLLPTHALTRRELAELEACPVEHRSEALLRYWVRKEALLKAAGVGLAVDPRTVEVSSPTESPRVLALPPTLGAPAGWSLTDVDLDGYVASLATDGPNPRVVLRALPRAPSGLGGGRAPARPSSTPFLHGDSRLRGTA